MDTKTPLPPLVSEYLKSLFGGLIPSNLTPVKMMGREWNLIIGMVEEIEADRQRTREVVQACVNALADPHKMSLAAAALSLAKSINIEPTK